MLDIRAVGYRYGKNVPDLFSGLDLRLEPGKIYGLLGRNGAGKTTLLKLAAGLLFPKAGEMTWDGIPVASRRPEVLADLFFLPETFFLPALKAGDYEKATAPFYPKFDPAAFGTALDEFQVDRNKVLSRLSHGQQKKFLLAFGLACGCRLNLLDEPTNGLDIPSKAQFRRLLASHLTDDRTFVLSTHQARDLDGLIDPVVIIDSGQVVFHHDRWTIDRGLVQASTRTEPGSGVLHAEKAWDTWVTLAPRTADHGESGPGIDLELLFNAVLARPDDVRAALEVSRG
jgi:ABC-2 type transport system ATP-binding protein